MKEKKMIITKKLVIRSLKDMGINVAAALLIGLAVRNIASANDFPMSGINGIMLLLHHFFGTPIGLGSLLLNIPIIAACYRFLSRKFILKSIATLLTIALVVDLVCPLLPTFTADKMLACICAGTLLGIGSALIFANN
ncbi:MAG: YitT family protein, partial [Clostridia bacterium]|nr:YitT family protein [Clostridia bacterium]